MYHRIHMSMQKKKRQARREYYLMLVAVVFPLNITQAFESTFHPKFLFSMNLGS
jgi:hypothetical protein